jgi:hypothetical protein
LAVNAVADAQIFGCHCDSHVLTHVDGAGPGHCGYEDDTVDALADLKTVHGRSDVKVGVFTADHANIFACSSVSYVTHHRTLV